MSKKEDHLYIVDNEVYLHITENETPRGFHYDAFDKTTGKLLYHGFISYIEMDENPIRNPVACARVMSIQDIGLEGRVVKELDIRMLDQIIA